MTTESTELAPTEERGSNDASRWATEQPDARAALFKQGLEPVGGTPEAFAAYIKSVLAKWTSGFRETGLQGEQVR